MTAVLDPDKVREALDEALPPGIDALEVVEVRTPDLADRLQASVWTLELPGLPIEEVEAAVAAFLAADVVEVQRLTKSGMRTFDARGPVVRLRRATRSRRLPGETRATPVRYSPWS